MRRYINFFQLLVLLASLLSGIVVRAQIVYDVHYISTGGNPGNLYTGTDGTTSGWTYHGGQHIYLNIWSSTIPIPFTFLFYGDTVSYAKASMNGILTFETNPTTLPSWENTNLPTNLLPDSSIAVFWDAFTTKPPTGYDDGVYSNTFGSSPHRQLWIRWTSLEYSNPGTLSASFAVVLEETTNKIYVIDMSDYSGYPITSTVGLQLNNTRYIQYGDSTIVFQRKPDYHASNNTYYEFKPKSAQDHDIAVISSKYPISGCHLGTHENLTIQINNLSPNNEDTIPVAYKINNRITVRDTSFNNLNAGSRTFFTFSETADLSSLGAYTIIFWIDNPNDPDRSNDTLIVKVFNSRVDSFPFMNNLDALTSLETSPFELIGDRAFWDLHSGITPTSNTGPNGDHTTGSGKYYYLQANSYNESPSLIIPCLNISSLSTPMVSFWYHMYGMDMGDMYIEIDTGTGWITVDSLMGEQQHSSNDPWLQKNINLPAVKSQGMIELRWRAFHAYYRSEMAIDDIIIYDLPHFDGKMTQLILPPSSCNLTHKEPIKVGVSNSGIDTIFQIRMGYQVHNLPAKFETFQTLIAPGDTVSLTFSDSADLYFLGDYTVTAFVADTNDTWPINDTAINIVSSRMVNTYPAAINFDQVKDYLQLGPLVQDQTDTRDWLITKGTTPTANTGPLSDHTSGNGNYIYINSSLNSVDTLNLVFPCVDLTAGNFIAMSFWYFMYGNAMGNLYVEVDTGNGYFVVDSMIGQQQKAIANPWRNKILNLFQYGSRVISVRFRGITGSGITSDIAIDDILFYEKPAADIGVVDLIQPFDTLCGDSSSQIKVAVKNFGGQTQTSIPLAVTISGAANLVFTDTFTIALAPGTTDTLTLTSTFNSYNGGTYNFIAATLLSTDAISNNDTLIIPIYIEPVLAAPIIQSVQACYAGKIDLIAPTTPGIKIDWYDSSQGGNLLVSGDTFLTPFLQQSVSYYAEARRDYGFPIKITEVSVATPDYIELQNVSNQPFDASGYRVLVSDSYSNKMIYNSTAWSLGNFSANEIQYRTDDAFDNYWGSNLLFNSNENGWAMIIDSNGNVVDFVAWGWDSTTIKTLTIFIVTQPYSPGPEWTGNGTIACWTGEITRIGNKDHNNQSDFVCAPGTKGIANVGLQDFTGCESSRTIVNVTFLPAPKGIKMQKGIPYNGNRGGGTILLPSRVCTGDSLTYEITPPNGFSNTDYGIQWEITGISALDQGNNPPNDTNLMPPVGTSNAKFQFIATSADVGKIFTVRITIGFKSSGCDTTLSEFIYVAPKAFAAFDVKNVCDGDTVKVLDQSTVSSGSISYSWNFGDNTTSANAAPTHVYSTPGTYNINLTTTGAFGCSSMASKSITIFDKPVTSISYTDCDSFVSPSGRYTWKNTGIFYDTLTTTTGCDSIIILNLTINRTGIDTISLNACDSFISPSGKYVWKSNGLFNDTISTLAGCDSILIIYLSINFRSVDTIYVNSCDSFTWAATGLTYKSDGIYLAQLIDGKGCDSIVHLSLTLSKSTNNNISTMVCDSLISPSGKYTWKTSGVYKDTLTNYIGCDSIITVNVTIDSDCVWPGDANKDNVANNLDILAIGIQYGKTGSARSNASNNWTAQPAANWTGTLKNGHNIKHTDCDGNGIIAMADTTAVSLNYNNDQIKTGLSTFGGPNDPALEIKLLQDTLVAGALITTEIRLGSPQVNAEDIYALAYTLSIPEEFIAKGSLSLTYSNSWLGNINELIYLSKVSDSEGEIETAVSRTNQTNSSGTGVIATLQFRLKNPLPTTNLKIFRIEAKDILIINANEDVLSYYLLTDSISLISGLEEQNLQHRVHVFPNPARNEVIVEFDHLQVKEIQMLDLNGKVLRVKNNNMHFSIENKVDFNTASLPSGIYFLKVLADEGVVLKQLVIVK